MAPYLEQSHVARTVFDASVAVFLAAELLLTLRRRPSAAADLRSEVVFRVVFFAAILMLPVGRLLVPSARIGGGAVVFALGAAVAWLGVLLRWWSVATLGSYFTTVVRTSGDQRVVDRGPYRVLRHPAYTGLLLAFVGCGVMVGSWVSLAGSFVLALAGLVYRMRVEEHALVAALGDAYRDFARGRARLVPFVW
ncbi:methyltransferase family protein [Xylanimonas sp. McL0601]|uniref:methyltransferase family protein n=1 Tax=Xylanimonas sp. McL0601 TaxID=3414739 RepID=UPI003CFB09F3